MAKVDLEQKEALDTDKEAPKELQDSLQKETDGTNIWAPNEQQRKDVQKQEKDDIDIKAPKEKQTIEEDLKVTLRAGDEGCSDKQERPEVPGGLSTAVQVSMQLSDDSERVLIGAFHIGPPELNPYTYSQDSIQMYQMMDVTEHTHLTMATSSWLVGPDESAQNRNGHGNEESNVDDGQKPLVEGHKIPSNEGVLATLLPAFVLLAVIFAGVFLSMKLRNADLGDTFGQSLAEGTIEPIEVPLQFTLQRISEEGVLRCGGTMLSVPISTNLVSMVVGTKLW